jgi:hypothetical protein
MLSQLPTAVRTHLVWVVLQRQFAVAALDLLIAGALRDIQQVVEVPGCYMLCTGCQQRKQQQ